MENNKFYILYFKYKFKFKIFLKNALVILKEYLKICWAALKEFFKIYWIALKEKIYEDLINLRIFYKNLLNGIYQRFALFLTKSNFGYLIKFIIWIIYYYWSWILFIYPTYLMIKLSFFTLKYIWNYTYFTLLFIIDYFLQKNNLLKYILKILIKSIFQPVNFIIFNGIPNLFSKIVWIERVKRYLWYLHDIILAILEFIYYLIIRLPYAKNLTILSAITLWMWLIEYIKFLTNLRNTFKIILKKKQYLILLKYNMFKYIYSDEGFFIWNKNYKLRTNFLIKNIRDKSSKYFWKTNIYFINYYKINISFYFKNKYLFYKIKLKNKLHILINFYLYKLSIIYQKITIFFSFIFI